LPSPTAEDLAIATTASRAALALLLAAAACAPRLSDIPTLRQLPVPMEVKRFIDRRMGCNHWSGEEAYDADRGREIDRALRTLRCDRLEADARRLAARHAADPAVLKALDETRDEPW